jgi:hypothetical protein
VPDERRSRVHAATVRRSDLAHDEHSHWRSRCVHLRRVPCALRGAAAEQGALHDALRTPPMRTSNLTKAHKHHVCYPVRANVI